MDDPDQPLEPRAMTCGNGTPWTGTSGCGPCSACLAESSRMSAEFRAAVARGEYDDRGYEPTDRGFNQEKLF